MDCGSSSSSSDWEEELEAIAAFIVLNEEYKLSKTRDWVHTIIKKRETLGEFHRLVQDLHLNKNLFSSFLSQYLSFLTIDNNHMSHDYIKIHAL